MVFPHHKDKEEHGKYLAKYDIDPQRAMFTIILSILVDVFGYSMVLPLLPSIAKTFGASDFFVGVLISSNALTALIFGPILGKLSDRFGRKPLLVISQAGTGISFLILALSPNISIIFFARILDGVFGGQIPIIRAYIADITTPRTRSQEMSKIMVGHTGGMIFGPVIGGLLGTLNWRYPSLLASGLSVVAILLTLKILVESLPKERIADLKAHYEELELLSGNRRKTMNKEVAIRLFQVFLVFMINNMLFSSFPLILDKRFGANPLIIGTIMTTAGVVIMLYAGIFLKPIIRKVGEKRMLVFAMILMIGNFLIFPYLLELWMAYVFVIPFAVAMSMLPPLIQSNLTKAVDPDKQGEVSGYATNFQSFAQILAPLLATSFLQIGGWVISSLYLNAYQLIGFTAVFFGVILLIVGLIDIKTHPHLYE
ncbi:MAG: Tetracycline resistance protein, class C [Promethearchaeota archaeon]|nr:MAG: Tetracycline resistance protein, class C [Candidatus Lokiarchaeota archaeon]